MNIINTLPQSNLLITGAISFLAEQAIESREKIQEAIVTAFEAIKAFFVRLKEFLLPSSNEINGKTDQNFVSDFIDEVIDLSNDKEKLNDLNTNKTVSISSQATYAFMGMKYVIIPMLSIEGDILSNLYTQSLLQNSCQSTFNPYLDHTLLQNNPLSKRDTIDKTIGLVTLAGTGYLLSELTLHQIDTPIQLGLRFISTFSATEDFILENSLMKGISTTIHNVASSTREMVKKPLANQIKKYLTPYIKSMGPVIHEQVLNLSQETKKMMFIDNMTEQLLKACPDLEKIKELMTQCISNEYEIETIIEMIKNNESGLRKTINNAIAKDPKIEDFTNEYFNSMISELPELPTGVKTLLSVVGEDFVNEKIKKPLTLKAANGLNQVVDKCADLILDTGVSFVTSSAKGYFLNRALTAAYCSNPVWGVASLILEGGVNQDVTSLSLRVTGVAALVLTGSAFWPLLIIKGIPAMGYLLRLRSVYLKKQGFKEDPTLETIKNYVPFAAKFIDWAYPKQNQSTEVVNKIEENKKTEGNNTKQENKIYKSVFNIFSSSLTHTLKKTFTMKGLLGKSGESFFKNIIGALHQMGS